MARHLDKPWRPLEQSEIDRLTGQLGVYEIADKQRQTLLLAYAGGRSLFGLKQKLSEELAARGPGCQFRLEVTNQYTTRYKELFMVHEARHGVPPPENTEPSGRYGRLSPA